MPDKDYDNVFHPSGCARMINANTKTYGLIYMHIYIYIYTDIDY